MPEKLKENIAMANNNNDIINCIALGMEDAAEELVEVVEQLPGELGVDQRLDAMEDRLIHITNALDSLFQIVKNLRDQSSKEMDAKIYKTIEKKKQEKKLEIPEGTLHGTSNGLSYFCTVKGDGFYVGETKYESLSAAAQDVSGVRRSGLTFWKLPDGRTVKEAYKKV